MFAQSIVRCKQRMKQRTLLHLLPEVLLLCSGYTSGVDHPGSARAAQPALQC